MHFDIKSQAPMFLRYALFGLGNWLMSRGFISEEANTFLGSQADIIVGIIIQLAALGWASFQKPTAKGMELAHETDAKVPASTTIKIKTPEGVPDIEVKGS